MTIWKTLSEGSVNDVWTDGHRIRRPRNTGSAAVHDLLRVLEESRTEGVPRFLSVEGQFEILSFLPGNPIKRPWPPEAFSLNVMAQVGENLRGIHDQTIGFESSNEFAWRPEKREAEVLCHGDLGPWNILLEGETVTGFIDWDLAHRGSRLWDLTTVAIELAPLSGEIRATLTLRTIMDRLSALCDSYGDVSPEQLVEYAPSMLRACATELRTRAEGGDRLFVPLVDAGHPRDLEEDAAFIERTYRIA